MKSANVQHWDFYKRYRRRMQKLKPPDDTRRGRVVEILLLGPDLLHLSLKLLGDGEVPIRHKAVIGAAVAYFISPVDLLPEIILGPFGFLDDIVVLSFVLNNVLNDIPHHLVERHWAGDGDLLTVLRGVVLAADRMLGKGLWQRLKRQFTPPSPMDRIHTSSDGR